MREKLLNVATMVVVACTVLVTALFVKRELTGHTPTRSSRPTKLKECQTYAREGRQIGPANAPVTVVAFSDYQCPHCRVLARTLDTLRNRHPADVRVIYRHFPLESAHPFVRQAAIAAECAGEQGRFEAFHDSRRARESDARGDRGAARPCGIALVSRGIVRARAPHELAERLRAALYTDVRAWMPGGGMELAWLLTPRAAVAAGYAMAAYYPLATIPKGETRGPSFQRFLASGLEFYGSRSSPRAFSLTGRWTVNPGTRLLLALRHRSLSPARSGAPTPFVPNGTGAATDLAIAVTLGR